MKQKNNVITNASWIIVCKVLQSVCAFFIGVFTARYLGPSNYGVISYAASITAFFLPLMQLGFNGTLVREIIAQPDSEGQVIGTALVLNLLASIACIIGITTFSFAVKPTDFRTIIVCFLYSLTLLFQALEAVQYWFQAKLLSKYSSITSLVAYVVITIYKVYILIAGKSIYWFAVVHVIEAMVIATVLIALYSKLTDQKLSFSIALGKQLLSRSKYYIISSMMVVVFQQTDRIMLKLMMSEAETGYYSAALTCVGITGFVFTAIIDSARPSILVSKNNNEILYQKKVVSLFSIITAIGLLQSVVMTVMAKMMITVMYGDAFLPAIRVLQISVWSVSFGYYGTVRNVWVLAEEKQKYLFGINVAGAAANVLLNWLMIPIWGAVGAAVASLITQFFTNVVIGFIFKPIRRCNSLMLKSLNPKVLGELIRNVTREMFAH